MTPSALRISADGMPALEQLVPMTAAMFSSETSARAAAVPPSAEQPSSWWLNSTSWPAISGRMVRATSAPYWLSSPSDSFAPVITSSVPMMIGSPSAISTHPNSSASQSAVPPAPPLLAGVLPSALGSRAAAAISAAGGEDEHQHDEQSAPSHVLLHPVNFLHWCARVRSARRRARRNKGARHHTGARSCGAIVCALQRRVLPRSFGGSAAVRAILDRVVPQIACLRTASR